MKIEQWLRVWRIPDDGGGVWVGEGGQLSCAGH